MLPIKQQLTPATFNPDDKWDVQVGNEHFILNGIEAQVLKDATIKGNRGLVWFRDMAISIPHISSVVKIKSVDTFNYQLQQEIDGNN